MPGLAYFALGVLAGFAIVAIAGCVFAYLLQKDIWLGP